jgi:hypothetical protein
MARKGKDQAAATPAPGNTLMGWLSKPSPSPTAKVPAASRAKSVTPAPKRRKTEHIIDIATSSPPPARPIASTSKLPAVINCSPPPPPSSVVYDVDADEEVVLEPDMDFDEVAAGDDFGPPEQMIYEDPDEAEVMVLDEDAGGATMCCPICSKDLGMTEEKVRRRRCPRCTSS